jgi:hypothetical protein
MPLNRLTTLWPTLVTARKITPAISAEITAYSIEVVPLSPKNVVIFLTHHLHPSVRKKATHRLFRSGKKFHRGFQGVHAMEEDRTIHRS